MQAIAPGMSASVMSVTWIGILLVSCVSPRSPKPGLIGARSQDAFAVAGRRWVQVGDRARAEDRRALLVGPFRCIRKELFRGEALILTFCASQIANVRHTQHWRPLRESSNTSCAAGGYLHPAWPSPPSSLLRPQTLFLHHQTLLRLHATRGRDRTYTTPRMGCVKSHHTTSPTTPTSRSDGEVAAFWRSSAMSSVIDQRTTTYAVLYGIGGTDT